MATQVTTQNLHDSTDEQTPQSSEDIIEAPPQVLGQSTMTVDYNTIPTPATLLMHDQHEQHQSTVVRVPADVRVPHPQGRPVST